MAGRDSAVEQLRPRLFGIAFRMLGDVQDAEDLVQEAMLRLQSSREVQEPEAWLVSVVTRLSIDKLRKARTARASYPGPWLPEPVAEETFSPGYRSELASDLSMAFLVLLERLAPEERAAFLLREVFGSGYGEIARVLEKSEAAARQIVHRARDRVRADRARFTAPHEVKERLLGGFITALTNGDKDALLGLFSKEMTWTADGGPKVRASRRVLMGAPLIARMLVKFGEKHAGQFTYRLVRLNGEPAVLERLSGGLFGVTFCETDGERLSAMYRVVNPDKLTHVISDGPKASG
ncbi:MAG TPA: RNA polymerase sigma factor SigJ [Myxococcales bacterium]|nr:RNA polymerase sigma factor SigJ [Myxococcales bacterium]